MENLKKENIFERERGGVFSLFIIVYLVSILLIVGALTLTGVNGFWFTNLSSLPICLAVMAVFFIDKRLFVQPQKNNEKFKPLTLLYGALLAFGMLFAFGYVNEVFITALKTIGLTLSVAEILINTVGEYLVATLFICLIPAIFEELFFRGILIKGLTKNPIICSLLSGLCFALYHFSLAQFLYQFIYGFILCLLAIKSKNILPCMLAHFLNNFIIITCNFISVKLPLANVYAIVIGACLIGLLLWLMLKDVVKIKSEEKFKWGKFFALAWVGLALSAVMIICNV